MAYFVDNLGYNDPDIQEKFGLDRGPGKDPLSTQFTGQAYGSVSVGLKSGLTFGAS